MANKPLYMDIHVLQTVPPSNINRDDTGSPKTARFGGVTRARVSSQAWKKATRDAFAAMLDENKLGQRTKYATELISDQIVASDADIEREVADSMAADVLGATGIKVGKQDGNGRQPTGYLLFISPYQALKLAELALEAKETGCDIDKKKAKDVLDIKKNPLLNAIDIALFGRMVADAPDLNADASVQVAQAIGISKSETEFDYFTAMDDRSAEDNAGAGMIGTTEFTSATFYRYATLDVAHLYENLGSSNTAVEAGKAFVKAFITSMPTGKQNTFAARTLPSAIIVQMRNTQPVSLVNAFEMPINAIGGKSQTQLACEALVKQESLIDNAFGTQPEKTFVVSAAPGAEVLKELTDGDFCTLDELVESVGQHMGNYLSDCISSEGR